MILSVLPLQSRRVCEGPAKGLRKKSWGPGRPWTSSQAWATDFRLPFPALTKSFCERNLRKNRSRHALWTRKTMLQNTACLPYPRVLGQYWSALARSIGYLHSRKKEKQNSSSARASSYKREKDLVTGISPMVGVKSKSGFGAPVAANFSEHTRIPQGNSRPASFCFLRFQPGLKDTGWLPQHQRSLNFVVPNRRHMTHVEQQHSKWLLIRLISTSPSTSAGLGVTAVRDGWKGGEMRL